MGWVTQKHGCVLPSASSQCDKCDSAERSPTHLFSSCQILITFWTAVLGWLKRSDRVINSDRFQRLFTDSWTFSSTCLNIYQQLVNKKQISKFKHVCYCNPLTEKWLELQFFSSDLLTLKVAENSTKVAFLKTNKNAHRS